MKSLPEYEIIERGLLDISENRASYYSAILYSAKSRLLKLGISLDGVSPEDPAMETYRRLYVEFGDGAHSKLNALNRRLLSFIRAREREIVEGHA